MCVKGSSAPGQKNLDFYLTNTVATSWRTNLVKGKTGIVTYQGSVNPGPNTAPDATFDNFMASPVAPIISVSSGPGLVNVSWSAHQEGVWVLESSPTLGPDAVWTEVPFSALTFAWGNLSSSAAPDGISFFRLRRI